MELTEYGNSIKMKLPEASTVEQGYARLLFIKSMYESEEFNKITHKLMYNAIMKTLGDKINENRIILKLY